MDKKILLWALFLGFTAIILGAFGAHLLKNYLSTNQLTSFETGVKYQMYHALFLLFLATNSFISNQAKKSVFLLTIIGVLLFSGSIYLLSTMPLSQINFKPIGFVTPIGGFLLLGAWALLFVKIYNKKV